MRSIEYLLQLYPEKTGKEILQIQQQDKLEDEKEYERYNASKIALVKELTANGAYYRGRFGQDQYFYYRFFNLVMDGDTIMCSVEQVTCFFNQRLKHKTINIDRAVSDYKKFENFGIEICERITKEEWDAVNNHLEVTFSKYW
jgi:hypothetical protein